MNELINKPEFGITEPTINQPGVMALSSQTRELAREQSARIMAKQYPRNPKAALTDIAGVCSRFTLAKGALYEYKKGGAMITGPSIRLAEQLVRCWGNIQYGFNILEQEATHSIVRAYATDLESNVTVERTFYVEHRTKSKESIKTLTDPREIYEHIANQASRRVRACMLEIIPGDIVEYAVGICQETVHSKLNITQEKIQILIDEFAKFGVTQAMLEKKIQSKITVISGRKYCELQQIWISLNDGAGEVEDFFDTALAEQEATAVPSLTINADTVIPKSEQKSKSKKKETPTPQPVPEAVPVTQDAPAVPEEEEMLDGAEDAFSGFGW